VGRAGPVEPGTGDHPGMIAVVPGAFGEQAEVLEAGIGDPGLRAVGAPTGGAAPAMAAVLVVHAGGQLPAVAAPVRGDTAAGRTALDVRRHRHRHRAIRVRVAQAVVVHDVVGEVVEGGRLQVVQVLAEVVLLEIGRAHV